MSAETLFEQALQLPPEERELLCERIWQSLDRDTAEEEILLTSDQEEELKRRIEHAQAHPEDGISWEEFKAEILETRGLRL